MTSAPLWPADDQADLSVIEDVPLRRRPLPPTTYGLLVRAASEWADHTAITILPSAQDWRTPITRTFGELSADVHRISNMLLDSGVRRTTPVALIAPNCYSLLTATIAAQVAGVAAPVNSTLSVEHVATMMQRINTRHLVVAAADFDAASWHLAEKLDQSGLLDTVFAIRSDAAHGRPEPAHLAGAAVHDLIGGAGGYDGAQFNGEPPRADDIAAIFHTGGTTGLPKLAAHTHANEVADAWMIAARSMFPEHSTMLAGLPLFHVNALIVTVLAPLLRGQNVAWLGPAGYRDPALYGDFWKIVERYRATTMSAVPTVYSVLAGCPVDADTSSMQMAVVGASPLPDTVRREFEAHTSIPLVQGYGLTEATCASATNVPHHSRHGSVGQRLPYQRIKTITVSDDGSWADTSVGETGVVAISGPTVFPGYVVGRNATGAFILDGCGQLRDGWLNTGDLGRLDEDGFLYLTGRAKDLIIRGGHNIDPVVIEDALLTHPDVSAAAAVGRPDAHAGELPVAYMSLRPGASVTEDELLRYGSTQVAEPAARPKAVTILPALPTTAVGKPNKVPLRADAARRAVTDVLATHPSVATISADVDDGAPIVTVTVTDAAAVEQVEQTLGRLPLAYRVFVSDT